MQIKSTSLKSTLVQIDHSPSCFGKTHLMTFSLT